MKIENTQLKNLKSDYKKQIEANLILLEQKN